MPKLLHEFWIDEDECGSGFGRVSEIGDLSRAKMEPGSRFVFEIWASSSREAMRYCDERAYGEVGNSYDHLPETVYTDADAAEQQAYLIRRRKVH